MVCRAGVGQTNPAELVAGMRELGFLVGEGERFSCMASCYNLADQDQLVRVGQGRNSPVLPIRLPPLYRSMGGHQEGRDRAIPLIRVEAGGAEGQVLY